MRRPLGGYTLIEVMIFLAVSSAILAMSIVVVGGQEAHSEFRSSMADVNAKIQQLIDGVANGLTGTSSAALAGDYDCSLDVSGHPQLTPKSPSGGNARGANPECIFLGRAIAVNDQAKPDNDQINTYTILGRRIFTSPVDGVQDIVDNLFDANPIAAVFPGSPPTTSTIDLTDHYKIPDGVYIKKVTSVNKDNITDSHMAGFFNTFLGEHNSFVGNTSNLIRNGSLSLVTVQYPIGNVDPGSPEPADSLACIMLTGPNCNNPSNPPSGNLWTMRKWQICFGSERNGEQALITVSSSDGLGVSTRLDMDVAACP